MIRRSTLTLTLLAGILVTGCSKTEQPAGPSAGAPLSVPKSDVDTHGHKKSQHGGRIFHVGNDNYHVDAIFEKGGTLRIYTLGPDESKSFEVEAVPLTAFAKEEGGKEATSFQLKPEALPGDAKGMTTQFVGQLPNELAGKKLEVTIPAMRFGGERFRVAVKNFDEKVHGEDHMPAKVADDEERRLYLTAGGRYTEADIQANGRMTASEKFKGVMAAHDMKPRPGDKVCPITATKANPKFTWIVGGKKYEFCCPPCVDEFVTTAKEKPEEIQEPEAYRQK